MGYFSLFARLVRGEVLDYDVLKLMFGHAHGCGGSDMRMVAGGSDMRMVAEVRLADTLKDTYIEGFLHDAAHSGDASTRSSALLGSRFPC